MNTICSCGCGAHKSFFSVRRAERWLDHHAELHQTDVVDVNDWLAPSRGIVIGLILGLLVWLLIIAAVSWIIGGSVMAELGRKAGEQGVVR